MIPKKHTQIMPAHPGALLREQVLPAMNITISEFARGIGVSRQAVHKILAEHMNITPEMALRIGQFVGNGPEQWLGLQQDYDLWKAKQSLKKELEVISKNRELLSAC